MKKSNSLIISLLVFSFLAMIASGFSLKNQFDAIEILPLNWTATKIRNLVVDYEKRTQKIQCQLQS